MKNPIQRIAAIHDLSGFGKVSLTVAIPILSTMGFQVCPLPTAILSTNTEIKGFKFVDLTAFMPDFISHWKTLDLKFDGIYSGFLGSHHQIKMVESFIEDFKQNDQIIVVDPVLGDDGCLYESMTADMVNEMKKLIEKARVITPNMTEACALLGKSYSHDIGESQTKDYLRALTDRGPEIAIITNVMKDEKKKKTFVYAYNRNQERFWKVSCDYIPANYPGTGDTFTSVITGSLMQGDSLPIALDRAVQFISMAIRATFGHNHDPRNGIFLEKVLNNLNSPIQNGCYQLID